jgi:hypothetical protein
MSSYLARLALRALGRPVPTRLLPRFDSRPPPRSDVERADVHGGELETGAPGLLREEQRARSHAPMVKREPASTPQAPIAEAMPGGSVRSVSLGAPFTPSAHVLSSRLPGAAPSDPSRVDEDEFGAASSPSMPRDAEARVEYSRPSSLAIPATKAARGTRNVQPTGGLATELVQQHDAGRLVLEAPERESDDASAPPAHAKAMRERATAFDTSVRPRSPTPTQPAGSVGAEAEPSSIRVEIGRIEVKVAQAPPVPAPRSRTAAEGFEGYWRARNYLDGPR